MYHSDVSWKTALIVPDVHVPYHHKKAVETVMRVGEIVNPNEIYFLGDLADFYFCNMHGAKHPETQQMAKVEVDAVNEFLDEWDARFPRQRKHYIEGNHEYRLERWLIAKAPELFGVTDWEMLFKLDRRSRWTVHPYRLSQLVPILNTDLYARHEPKSMSSPKASATKSLVSLVYGHIHRIEKYVTRTDDDKKILHCSPGWLGDIKYDKIFGYVKSQPNWNLGFAIVYGNTKTKKFHITLHGIEPDGSTVFNGQVIR